MSSWIVIAMMVIASCHGEPSKPPPAPAPAASVPIAGDAAAASSARAPLAVVDMTGKPLPPAVKVRGDTIASAKTFVDSNGTNYIAFSTTSKDEQSGETGHSRARVLYIDHWVVSGHGEPRELLPARDFYNDCEMGALTAAFVPGAFGVTDLDRDSIAEVTYGYQLACRSDVRPATYKLLLVEDGAKYILRGTSRLAHGPDGPPVGGEFTSEPAATAWPAGFYDHAVALWNTTDADLEP